MNVHTALAPKEVRKVILPNESLLRLRNFLKNKQLDFLIDEVEILADKKGLLVLNGKSIIVTNLYGFVPRNYRPNEAKFFKKDFSLKSDLKKLSEYILPVKMGEKCLSSFEEIEHYIDLPF